MIINDDNDVIRVVRNDVRVGKRDYSQQTETKCQSSIIRPKVVAAKVKYVSECSCDC